MLGISKDGEIIKPATAMKRKSVSFNEEEDVINPEDVDPTVGRFRNLVSSTIVIPTRSKYVFYISSLSLQFIFIFL